MLVKKIHINQGSWGGGQSLIICKKIRDAETKMFENCYSRSVYHEAFQVCWTSVPMTLFGRSGCESKGAEASVKGWRPSGHARLCYNEYSQVAIAILDLYTAS